MTLSSCHYNVLGLSPTCSHQEICKTYHKQSLKVHPDKQPQNKHAKLPFVPTPIPDSLNGGTNEISAGHDITFFNYRLWLNPSVITATSSTLILILLAWHLLFRRKQRQVKEAFDVLRDPFQRMLYDVARSFSYGTAAAPSSNDDNNNDCRRQQQERQRKEEREREEATRREEEERRREEATRCEEEERQREEERRRKEAARREEEERQREEECRREERRREEAARREEEERQARGPTVIKEGVAVRVTTNPYKGRTGVIVDRMSKTPQPNGKTYWHIRLDIADGSKRGPIVYKMEKYLARTTTS